MHPHVVVFRQGLLQLADPQVLAVADLALVDRLLAGNDPEQRGFAGTIAADQADALVRLQRQFGMAQDGQVAYGERDIIEGK